MAKDENTSTSQIDLGDDLLERQTGTLARERPLGANLDQIKSEKDYDDHFHSAQILFNEGMYEESKKILRKLIMIDPHRVVVRRLLDEIHEIELKEIFGDKPIRKPREKTQYRLPDLVQIGKDLHDLEIEYGETKDGEDSLFSNDEEMEKFVARLERDLIKSGSGLRDRADMGIAFYEMELFDIAARIFKSAASLIQSSGDIAWITSLTADAQIMAGKPLDAIVTIEPTLRDNEISQEDKLSLFYLMGRANEDIGQNEIASRWYKQVREISSNYRDIEERLRYLR